MEKEISLDTFCLIFTGREEEALYEELEKIKYWRTYSYVDSCILVDSEGTIIFSSFSQDGMLFYYLTLFLTAMLRESTPSSSN